MKENERKKKNWKSEEKKERKEKRYKILFVTWYIMKKNKTKKEILRKTNKKIKF